MDEAFLLATEALAAGEVPVGCIFVYRGQIVAAGRNKVNACKNATEHAEMVAIRLLEKWCSNEKLSFADVLNESTLYVTLEPCIMCTAALRFCLPGRPKHIFFGAKNERFGGCGSVFDMHRCQSVCPALSCTAGVQEERAVSLLKQFYLQENPNAPENVRKSKPSAKHFAKEEKYE